MKKPYVRLIANRRDTDVLTEFCSVPAKPEPRQHHLSQAKRRPKARKPTNRHDTQKIEEKIDEEGINEAESV